MVTADPCALLERLVREPREAEWLEFKVNNANVHEIGEYVSALANSAMLADKDRGFLVFGIEDKTRRKVGTTIKLSDLRKGSENFTNWLSRMVEPRLMMEFLDFECDGSPFSILCVEPSYDRPVKFAGTEYIRVGENVKKLIEFPHHERSLWLMTSRRKFEEAIALTNQEADAIPALLDIEAFYSLLNEQVPGNLSELIRRFQSCGLLRDNMEGKFDVTNLGAILLAKDVSQFPSISGKAIRIVRYSGRDKSKSDFERGAIMGYAAGFANLMKWLMRILPKEERYISGVRRSIPRYPEIALREIIANALIHQDFTVSGSGPLIEIYSDRVELTNPGNSLIPADRLLDERRSRNEKLASLMRDLNICEERGSGLDKAMIEISALLAAVIAVDHTVEVQAENRLAHRSSRLIFLKRFIVYLMVVHAQIPCSCGSRARCCFFITASRGAPRLIAASASARNCGVPARTFTFTSAASGPRWRCEYYSASQKKTIWPLRQRWPCGSTRRCSRPSRSYYFTEGMPIGSKCLLATTVALSPGVARQRDSKNRESDRLRSIKEHTLGPPRSSLPFKSLMRSVAYCVGSASPWRDAVHLRCAGDLRCGDLLEPIEHARRLERDEVLDGGPSR
jgi:ATP-dependent DNA helicase RecG